MFNSLKSVAIAAVVIVATAGASLAAQYAYVDQDANVKFKPKKQSQTINQVWEGQQVKIIAYSGNWVKVQIPGKDGWIRENNLDWNNNDWDDYNNGKLGTPHCN